ncbi:MAG: PAS domain-containing protein [Thermodesulfobacteriota bacterium]
MELQPDFNAGLPSADTEPIEKIILRSMTEGVITVECNGEISSANPAALKILDLAPEEILGKRLREAFPDQESNRKFLDLLDDLAHGRTTDFSEIRFTRKDGQTLDLSVTTAFLDLLECVAGMENAVLVFRDVTAFKSLERVKKRAVNHLSHELETPLAVIAASVEQLFRSCPGQGSTTKNYERIRRNLDRLRDIQFTVKQIVDPPTVRPRPFDPTELARRTVEDVRRQTTHRGVALSLEADETGTVLMDPSILEFAIRALVKNAIENSPDGSEVKITLSGTRSGIELKVQDRGLGISVMDRPFILEGLHHTQATQEYSSKKPFDFNAGGKGLELLRLKAWSEAGLLDISFDSERCPHIPGNQDRCPGSIADCPHVADVHGCRESGGTTFTVRFRAASVTRGDDSVGNHVSRSKETE